MATAIALPPLEPPGIRVGSCGLRACGLVTPSANSCVEVLPRITAPAARHRSTASASSAGTRVVGVGAAAGADAADVDDVLDRDRDAVQRSAAAAGAQLGVAGAGLGQRVLGDRPRRTPSTRPARPRERQLGQLDARRRPASSARAAAAIAPALRQAAEGGQRRGGRAEDLVCGAPLRRVDDLRAEPSAAASNAVGGELLMAVPPRTCARAARPRGAPRPPRERSMCTRISAAAASARPARSVSRISRCSSIVASIRSGVVKSWIRIRRMRSLMSRR